MNILIKLMSIVSLVLAPTLAQVHRDDNNNASKKEIIITPVAKAPVSSPANVQYLK